MRQTIVFLILLTLISCGDASTEEINGLPGVHVGDTLNGDRKVLSAKDGMVEIDNGEQVVWVRISTLLTSKFPYSVTHCPHK